MNLAIANDHWQVPEYCVFHLKSIWYVILIFQQHLVSMANSSGQIRKLPNDLWATVKLHAGRGKIASCERLEGHAGNLERVPGQGKMACLLSRRPRSEN